MSSSESEEEFVQPSIAAGSKAAAPIPRSQRIIPDLPSQPQQSSRPILGRPVLGRPLSTGSSQPIPPVDRNFGQFEKHTKGIGSKLMFKMGFKVGSGLGKDGKGIIEPISVKKRPSGTGIGHNEFQEKVGEKVKVKVVKVVKRGYSKGVKRGYKTAIEVIQETTVEKRDKVTDMTGRSENELVHNLNKLVRICKHDLVYIAQQMKREEIAQSEGNELAIELEKDRQRIATLVQLKGICQTIHESDTVEEMVDLIEDRALSNEFHLDHLIVGKFESLLSVWNPLKSPLQRLQEYKRVLSVASQDVCDSLIVRKWIPPVLDGVDNWTVLDSECMIELVEGWKGVVPTWSLDVLRRKVVMKIEAEILNTDIKGLGRLVFPWLLILPIDSLLLKVRHKLCSEINLKVFLKWEKVLKIEDLAVVYDSAVGHLSAYLSNNLIISPSNQDVSPLLEITQWSLLLGPRRMESILDKAFLPKWTKCLVDWLQSSTVDLNEVGDWYLAWKAFFADHGLDRWKGLKGGLDLINQLLSNPTISNPTLIQIPAAKQPIKVSLTFRDLVELEAEERDIEFVPLNKKSLKGLDLFKLGKLKVYIEDGVLFCLLNGIYTAKSVTDALNLAI